MADHWATLAKARRLFEMRAGQDTLGDPTVEERVLSDQQRRLMIQEGGRKLSDCLEAVLTKLEATEAALLDLRSRVNQLEGTSRAAEARAEAAVAMAHEASRASSAAVPAWVPAAAAALVLTSMAVSALSAALVISVW